MEGLRMEEQLVGLANNDATYIAKGKRTKRLKLLSPCGVAVSTTTVTPSCSSDGSFSSNETTYESADQEEEDMANCLILLAQGGNQSHHEKQLPEHDHGEKGNTRRFTEMASTINTNTNTNTKVGFFIYECKTCNRTFPSFQALGGHRASHKKSKLMAEEKKPPSPPPPPPPQIKMIDDEFEEREQPHMKSVPPISLQLVTNTNSHKSFHGNKTKIHECSICGSEFTTGQALGGHMRRHRATSSTNTTTETSFNTTTVTVAADQPRNILQLDLNLPAPEDDLRESKFQFPATQKSMVLSAAPALVDCHY